MAFSSSSPFPCEIELIAASALLLLSEGSPSSSVPNAGVLHPSSPLPLIHTGFVKEISEDCSESSLIMSCLRSSPSAVTNMTSDRSSEEILAHRQRISDVLARCQEIKLKVVKKSRSKMFWSSDCRKLKSVTMVTGCESESTEGSSCLSSSSSGISTARSSFQARVGGMGAEVRRKLNGSSHMHRRAEAILKLLSGGSSSEVRIRELLGDSPDTSKALRMLLKLNEVKRYGAGGRGEPYIYMIK